MYENIQIHVSIPPIHQIQKPKIVMNYQTVLVYRCVCGLG